MKVSTLRALFLLLVLSMVPVGELRAAPGKWDVFSVRGVDYVRLNDVWNFYGFTKRVGRSGFISYGAGDRTVSLRPSRQDFYVNN